ncbi:class I SAM-dependent methyltransferase [Nocardia goodfellowii]|uniref:Ubiquinone/menaquinone biosynthesis C-methylase UbiE n=1 Tax=Nocardia goodfellowii TaxID=882446 RepID=A0ABS4QTX6_9NOCA|nr:methyltransferase domain-containing protein [Nocardia goodfellowii]MBP2194499.1 ubiquinone/menaquinone biosynthesis C-methylase UbiE [Nocardia goodfellowii]
MKHPIDTDVLGEFLVSARSLAEYRAIFDLTDADLKGRRILDCPGGAASFTMEAGELGARVTAADPIYSRSAEQLRSLATRETDRGTNWATAHYDRYRWDWYGDPEGLRAMRRAAAARFADDLTAHPERYIAAELPSLPFRDNSFDLVLSSHLLFTYADRLDADFHLTALLELSRVSAAEVRLYPLVDHIGRHHDVLVEQLRKELRDKGVHSTLRETEYEFHHGAHTMLILHGD